VAAGPERGVTDATVGAGFADGAGVVEPWGLLSSPGPGFVNTVSAISLSFRVACGLKRPTSADSAMKPNGLVVSTGADEEKKPPRTMK